MKKACIKAIHEMEERYSKLIIEYYSLEQKERIFNAIMDTIKEFNISPRQMIIPKDETSGEYCLEFHDDYDKSSGEFFEKLLKTLDISHCEIG
jgi:hypothetical protein